MDQSNEHKDSVNTGDNFDDFSINMVVKEYHGDHADKQHSGADLAGE